MRSDQSRCSVKIIRWKKKKYYVAVPSLSKQEEKFSRPTKFNTFRNEGCLSKKLHNETSG
jgi:hypothetical protein